MTVLLLIGGESFADAILLKNEKRISGRILYSDNQAVYIADNDSTFKVPHGLIDHIVFSASDLVHMLDGRTIACKIIDRVFPNLILLTPQGILSVNEIDVLRFFYAAGNSITLNSLPQTGKIFSNPLSKSKNIWQQKLKRNVFIGLRGGYMSVSDAWQNVFQNLESITAFPFSIQAGYLLLPDGYLKAGYETAGYEPSNSTAALGLNVSTVFLYAGYEQTFPAHPEIPLYFTAGLEAGLINFTSGSIPGYIGKSTFAFKPIGGISYYLNKYISLNFEAAYMVATGKAGISTVALNTEGAPQNIELKLSGLNILVTFRYHLMFE